MSDERVPLPSTLPSYHLETLTSNCRLAAAITHLTDCADIRHDSHRPLPLTEDASRLVVVVTQLGTLLVFVKPSHVASLLRVSDGDN